MASKDSRRPIKARGPPPPSSPPAVPILRYRGGNNFLRFKEALSSAALREFGDLGRLVETGAYYEPPMPDISSYDRDADPDGIIKAALKEDARAATQSKRRMAENQPKLYALIWQHLSGESKDEVKRSEGYEELSATKDPLKLWLAVKATHEIHSESRIGAVIKQNARVHRLGMRQDGFESIVSFKERFDAAQRGYDDSGNPPMDDIDCAIDFIAALDEHRYGGFKAFILNGVAAGAFPIPPTVNDAYVKASAFLTESSKAKSVSGSSFATADSGLARRPPKGGESGTTGTTRGAEPKPGSEKKNPAVAETLASDRRCYVCDQPGHVARNYPQRVARPKEVNATSRLAGTERYEVVLDNASEVSIMDPALLRNLRPAPPGEGFGALSGATTQSTSHIGTLEHFFECQACTSCTANILLQAAVEDIYEVSYVQGHSYTVHIDHRDLVFERRGMVYVADMSDWLQPVAAATARGPNDLSTKEAAKAKAACDFIAKSGYPSEREAVHMALDGNILSMDLTGDDIRRAFEIHGIHPAAAKGKTTRTNAVRQRSDGQLKVERKNQELFTDIMKVGGRIILTTVARPLMLTIVTPSGTESTEDLGKAFQSQLNLLRSRGFNPVKGHMDPQSSLAALVPHFPSIDLDVTGSVDHLDVIDAKIRRSKEVMRSVNASLQWKLSGSLIAPLARYAAARINARRTSSSVSNVAPRVAFTGRKIPAREFEIAFGEYLECTDPDCVSNNALEDRTESCIDLYPVGNENNSWAVFKFKTKRTVRRTAWRRMVTNSMVIDAMNKLADEDPVKKKANGDLDIEDETVAPSSRHPLVPAMDSPPAIRREVASHAPGIIAAGVQHPGNSEVKITAEAGDRGEPNRGKKGIELHGKAATNAVAAELIQLFRSKGALVPLLREELTASERKGIIRSSMFLKAIFSAQGIFDCL